MEITVVHTPGHTPGGICLKHDNILFTGDTLFAGGIGRTDLPGGSYEKLLKSIKDKIMTLDEDITIYPGHGPASTIGDEKHTNPFL
jgi:glyoxylase-like metal-dependent hydrolase (beta-lactamase superfamily II)